MLNFKAIAQHKDSECSVKITYYQNNNGVVTIHLETKHGKRWVNWDDAPNFIEPAYEQLKFMGIIEILRFLKICGYDIVIKEKANDR